MTTNQIKTALKDLINGITSHYPPCCIINYCIDTITGNENGKTKRHIHGLNYAPCKLCIKARKQTYQQTIIELLLDCGYLDDNDYHLLPNSIKALIINPPQQ